MNKKILSSILLWTGLIILNYWIFTYLGNEYNLERYVGMFCISGVTLFRFYILPILNKNVEQKYLVEKEGEQ